MKEGKRVYICPRRERGRRVSTFAILIFNTAPFRSPFAPRCTLGAAPRPRDRAAFKMKLCALTLVQSRRARKRVDHQSERESIRALEISSLLRFASPPAETCTPDTIPTFRFLEFLLYSARQEVTEFYCVSDVNTL